MSDFFESEFVQEELEEINQMQQEVYGHIMNFGQLDSGTKKEHIEKLSTLLEKQRLMYTRISLSDDPKAIEMKEHLQQSVQMMGFPQGTDINVLFSGMYDTIQALKQQVD